VSFNPCGVLTTVSFEIDRFGRGMPSPGGLTSMGTPNRRKVPGLSKRRLLLRRIPIEQDSLGYLPVLICYQAQGDADDARPDIQNSTGGLILPLEAQYAQGRVSAEHRLAGNDCNACERLSARGEH